MKPRTILPAAITAIAGLALATPAQADFISPVDAATTTNSEYTGDGRLAVDAGNWSGMTGIGTAATHDGVVGSMWLSNNVTAGAWIRFDLGEVYTSLEKIYIWNYNENHSVNSNNARGIKDFTVEVSSDDVTWSAPTSGANQSAAANPAPGYAAALPLTDTLDITASNVRYIRFTVVSSHSTSGSSGYVGISEVAFEGSIGPDLDPPLITSTDPADDATGVYPGAALVAAFDEPVALTSTGTITVTDGSDSRVVNLDGTADDGAAAVSGKMLTITLDSNLTNYGSTYDVLISNDAVVDLSTANGGGPNAFAGTAGGDWNFTTAAADGTAPVISPPTSPADGAADVLLDTSLSVTFDENILVNPGATVVLLDEDFESDNGGFGKSGTPNDWAWGPANSDNNAGLVLTGGNGDDTGKCWATNLGTGGPPPSGTIDTLADSILRSPDTAGNGIDLSAVASAQLQFAAAVDAADGDVIEVLVKQVGGGTLVTVPATELTPAVTAGWATYGPYDISDAVGNEVYLEFRFKGGNALYIGLYIDDVRVTGVATTNVITLKDLTNLTDTVIPIDDSSQVSVSGSTLTITPAATLAPMADYAIQIGSTAVRNYNDLNFAGIADTTTWNFATTGPRTLTWDPAGGGASDGAGTWLATGEWWDGTANVDWANSTPDNAVIGNGGSGGTITLGAVNAGTVSLDNFTGTYTLNGGSLAQSGGIAIGANAGNVNLPLPISGAGGITVNAPVRVNLSDGSKTFSGDLIVNAGEVLEYQGGDAPGSDLGTGNYTLNGGVHVDYWGGSFVRSLGTGPGQVQIPGGESGFCGQGRNGFNVRINNSTGYTVVWGASGEGAATGLFNPSTLILQSPWANTNGKMNFQNPLDLNGATRTVKVNIDHQGQDGYAIMSGAIHNSDGANPAGLIKSGPGRLIFTDANTYAGGTEVTAGTLSINAPGSLGDASMTISGGTVNGSGTLTFNIDGTTTDVITVSGGTLDASALTVNVNPTGSGLTQNEYVLVDATGGGTISETFAGLTGAPGYTLDYGTPNQVKLVGGGGGPTDADDAVSIAGFTGTLVFDPTGGTGGLTGLAAGSFAGFTGGTYSVQWSPDLVAPFVTVFGPVSGTGTSGTAGVQIPWSYETGDPQAFFRLLIE